MPTEKDLYFLAKGLHTKMKDAKEALEKLNIIDENGEFTDFGRDQDGSILYAPDGKHNFYGENIQEAVAAELGHIDWYCDGCNCYMNSQPGFTRAYGTWICTECGYTNDVSDNNIINPLK